MTVNMTLPTFSEKRDRPKESRPNQAAKENEAMGDRAALPADCCLKSTIRFALSI